MDPSAGTGSVPLEAIIQQAVALGMQPQQLLQLLSNQNSNVLQQIQQQQAAAAAAVQQHQQQAAVQQAAATSAQNLLLSQLPPSIHAVLSQQQAAAVQQNPALLLAQQQALVNQQAALAAAQQQQQQQQQAQVQRQKVEQQQPMMTSLAWPEHSPAVQIPHFDSETYKRVNIDIPYSAIPSGMDLPINNVDTLRFFFNFGVCQARAILEKLATRGNNSQPLPANLTNSALLKSISLHAAAQEQRGAFAGIQQQTPQSAVAQQMQAALSNPSSSITSLQQSLIQHMNRIGVAAGQSQTKMNDMTEAMMLQSALMNPSLAQLRSQPSGGHVLIPPASSLASSIQSQLGGLQAPHPLEHELIRPTPVNHLATVAAAAVASAASNATNIATNLPAHAALNVLQRSSNASTPNTVPSTAGSISAGTPLSNGGVLNSSSPKVSIPVDPAPRKPSAVAGHSEIMDLQQRGLMALRSPSLMNEGLQKSLAAVDAAFHGGNSITVTSGTSSTTTTNATEQESANSNLNDKMAAPLGAQLSAALYQSFVSSVAGDNRSGTQTPTATTVTGTSATTPVSSSTPTTGIGGIGIAASLTPGGKSITTGSAGIEKSVSLGYPTVMEVDGGPTILQASEMHYTETLKKNANFLPATDPHSSPQAESRRKSGLYALTSDVKEEKKDVKNEKPLIPMINYVNNCLKEAKTHLHSQGVGVSLDSLVKPVDFASRPIDPIFREGRKSLDRMTSYNEMVTSGINLSNFVKNQAADSTTSTVGSCLIGIAGIKSEPSTSGSKDDEQPKSNGHASHSPEEGEITEEDKKRKISEINNGRSASPEEIDVCGDSKTTEKKNGREEDLSSPDEKRLRIASASDDE